MEVSCSIIAAASRVEQPVRPSRVIPLWDHSGTPVDWLSCCELMQDLALYKKFRNKEVASAARGLIGLFRELAPGMLDKRDRGRGADVAVAPLSYGASRVASRVEGAELLQVRPHAVTL